MNYKLSILAAAGAVVILILQWSLLGLFSESTFGQIDRCYFDRFLEGPQHHHPSLLPKFLFWGTILCFVFLGVRANLKPPNDDFKKDDSTKAHSPLDLIFYLGTGISFYSVTYCLSKVIEYFLDDNICSRHFNGISGHYLFHIYFVLLFFYLRGFFSHIQMPQNLTFQTVLNAFLKDTTFVTVLGAAVSLSMITLSWTWLGGFHSPRQILYGVLLALLAHTAFVYLSENLNYSKQNGSNHRIQVVFGMAVALVVLLLISTVIGTWPFSILDFAATALINAATVYIAAQQS